MNFRLGTAREHTVYEGEGVGILLAITLMRRIRMGRGVTLNIGVDNQAAIQATQSSTSNSGHYIWDEIHKAAERICRERPGMKITIRWTPGHEGILGNEAADVEAKNAAQGIITPCRDLPGLLKSPLPISRSATKQNYRESLKKRADKSWKKSPRYARFNTSDISPPANKFHKATSTLRRKQASLLYQLKVGHVPLAKHLHRIKKSETPICPACQEEVESVHHFIIRCPAHQHWRDVMRTEGGINTTSLDHLLGNNRLHKHLFKFIGRTGRLHSVFGDIADTPSTRN